MNDEKNYTPILVADLPIKMEGDHPVNVLTEEYLRSLFSKVGRVIDGPNGVVFKIEEDCNGKPSAFAFVTFETQIEAERVIDEMNYTKIDNVLIRLIHVDELTINILNNGDNTFIVKKLNPAIEVSQLYQEFLHYDKVISCDLPTVIGKSFDYGLVHLSQFKNDNQTRAFFKNKMICGCNLEIESFKRPQQLEIEETFTNCFIKNLPKSIKTNEDLKRLFEEFGAVESTNIEIIESGENHGMGYCEMSTHEEAVRAIECLNEKEMEGNILHCSRTMLIYEKMEFLINQMEFFLKEYDFSNHTPILVSNLPIIKKNDNPVHDVTKDFLHCLFSVEGRIVSGVNGIALKTREDRNGRPSALAFITYQTRKEAKHVIKEMNYMDIDNIPIHITLADKETINILKNGDGTLYIKNLPPDIEESQLREKFEKYGEVIFCYFEMDISKSCRNGIVQFHDSGDAETAISGLNGTVINNFSIQIELYNIPQKLNIEKIFKKCCISNLPKSIKTNEDLKILFGKYGSVKSSRVEINENGENLGIGYCEMSTHEEAVRAVECLNERKIEGKVVHCSRIMTESERRDFIIKQMDYFLIEKENINPTAILVDDLPIRMQGDYLVNVETEDHLRSLFSKVGRVIDGPRGVVLKRREDWDGRPSAFAFVTFTTRKEAENVIKEMNYTKIDNIPIRLILAEKETNLILKKGRNCLIIKNLDPAVKISQIHEAFANFGEVISCWIPTHNGKSKGIGYVQFRYPKDYMKAKKNISNLKINDRLIEIEPYRSTMRSNFEDTFSKCCIKNLPKSIITDEDLIQLMKGFGTVKSSRIEINENGENQGIGYCEMSTHEEAVRAVKGLNERFMEGKYIQCNPATSESEKEDFLISQMDYFIEKNNLLDNTTIYVEDLPIKMVRDYPVHKVTEGFLRSLFSEVGHIISGPSGVVLKMKQDYKGIPSAFAFITFETREDAERAIKEMNYTKLDNVPMRLMLADRETNIIRRSGAGKLLVKNLPDIDISQLHDCFAFIGDIISCEIPTKNGVSLGYGIVQFRYVEDAEQAIKDLDGASINGRPVSIEEYKRPLPDF